MRKSLRGQRHKRPNCPHSLRSNGFKTVDAKDLCHQHKTPASPKQKRTNLYAYPDSRQVEGLTYEYPQYDNLPDERAPGNNGSGHCTIYRGSLTNWTTSDAGQVAFTRILSPHNYRNEDKWNQEKPRMRNLTSSINRNSSTCKRHRLNGENDLETAIIVEINSYRDAYKKMSPQYRCRSESNLFLHDSKLMGKSNESEQAPETP